MLILICKVLVASLEMKKYKFEYRFLVFLYAYLRQADLSLDRAIWSSPDELKNYYKNQIAPELLIDYLLSHSEVTNLTEKNQRKYPKAVKRIPYFFQKLWNGSFLTEREILHCIRLLSRLKECLSQTEVDKLFLGKLRDDIAIFDYRFLEKKLYRKDWKKVTRVAHYFQNTNAETINITDFLTFKDSMFK